MKTYALLALLVLIVACGGSEERPTEMLDGPDEQPPLGGPATEDVTEEEVVEIETEVDDLNFEDDLDFSELDDLSADFELI